MDKVDAVVIGAGVVGLAIARALSSRGLETLVLEREPAFGTGVSSRNSEVIHAGLYYPAGSLKARLCVEGRKRLYAYCDEHHVPHQRCGKLVVAVDDAQRDALPALAAKARVNGVIDVAILGRDEALALEPQLDCQGALLSPSTGIIDSHAFMSALATDVEAKGGMIVLRAEVASVRTDASTHVVTVAGDTPAEIATRYVVNAAGLGAVSLIGRIEGFPPSLEPRAFYCKGNYFALSGRAPFRRLIYPMPQDAWLGVHLTLDLGGQARFGPDVQWLPDDATAPFDFDVDPERAAGFYADIRRYWPGLPDDALQPAYSGIRPKIHSARESAPDFLVQGPSDHGIDGLVSLSGIESPGLTSSLALADHVLRKFGLDPHSPDPRSPGPTRR